MLPDNNTAQTLTLNVNIPEYVDLCAISKDAQTRVVTLEHGYRNGTVESCMILPPGDSRLTIRVTSSNAQPTSRTVRINSAIDHFPEERGRIIEFIT